MKRKKRFSICVLAALIACTSVHANWTDPAVQFHNNQQSQSLDLAINSSGVAAASYITPDVNIFAARLRPTSTSDTWTAESAGTYTPAITGLADGSSTGIAINNSGDVIAIAVKKNVTDTYFLYLIGGQTTFTSATTTVASTMDDKVDLAIDPSRNGVIAFAMSVYQRKDGNVYARPLWIDTSGPTLNFGSEQLIGQGKIGDTEADHAVVFDGSGNAYIVYEDTADGQDIKFTKFTRTGATTGTYDAAATDISDTSVNSHRQEIGVDSSGNVVIIWAQNEGVKAVKARTYSSGSWSTIRTISGSDDNTDHTTLAVNANGQAGALWVQKNTAAGTQIPRYAFLQSLASNTWFTSQDTPETLPGSVSLETASGISEAGQGTAILAWDIHKSGAKGINTLFFHYNGSSWLESEAVVVPQSAYYQGDSARLAMNTQGDAIVGWKQHLDTGTTSDNRIFSLYSNFFIHVFPFSNGSGQRREVKFFTQTERYNRVRWANNPNESGTVSSYKVYRNNLSDFIGTYSPTSTLRFDDHNRGNFLEKYLIITVLNNGEESFPYSIQVER